jgi:hypothetical protein
LTTHTQYPFSKKNKHEPLKLSIFRVKWYWLAFKETQSLLSKAFYSFMTKTQNMEWIGLLRIVMVWLKHLPSGKYTTAIPKKPHDGSKECRNWENVQKTRTQEWTRL